jgi:hypothetical protein
LQAVLTRAWEAAATVEATRVMAILAAETSAQEATTTCDSTTIHVKEVEDWATLVEREVWERVLRVEVENATLLASAREDVESLVRKVALLKGELAEVPRAREVAEDNFRGLSDDAARGV